MQRQLAVAIVRRQRKCKCLIVFMLFENGEQYVKFSLFNSRANMEIDDEGNISDGRAPQNVSAIIKVNFVSPGSPAELAGIRENDDILEFGSVTGNNFKDLAQIGEIVSHSQNQQIFIKARRNNRIHELTLVPKAWAGRGLLGCNIVLANNA